MVRNEDDQSFMSLTFAELLHPETAASTITRRQEGESPWATVYYEAVSGPVDYESVPVATNVVAVQDDIEAHPQQSHDISSARPGRREQSSGDLDCPHPLPKVQPWQHSNLVDLIFGFAFSLGAFITTIKIELTAIVIYTIAAGFYYLADEVFSSSPGLLAKSICLTVSGALMIVDAVLLTVSVLVTELLGGLAMLLCSCFGGPLSGNAWHQFIRKTCHLTRWGFRNCHKGWKPERIFPISMEDERSHLGAVPCEVPEADNDVHCAVSTDRLYTDFCARPSSACTCSRSAQCICGSDESTFVSQVTFLPNEEDIECPPITIGSENVSVVEETAESDDEPLFKNAEHVTMT